MRLLFWVAAVAVLSLTWAKNATTKAKPKRQLEDIRSPHNLQYSLVLPHSRVAHFRSLGGSNRRISHASQDGKLPPYAVQMEPVVQYSQKDPLYDRNHDNVDNTVDNKNEVQAQKKVLHVQDSSLEDSFGPPYGSLQTAPLYSNEHAPQYYEAPEPIIEIIIKESNETLPAPPLPPPQKKKKEPVHVFYVKYSKDPHSKDKVVYEKPIPAITPPTNDEDEHEHEHEHDHYVTVTPEPLYSALKTTTLRAIIKPESETYHSDSSVKITFGNEGRHYSGRYEPDRQIEDHEETAPRPAIAYPNRPPQPNIPIERSASPQPQFHESATRPTIYNPSIQHFQTAALQQAQSRIQYQPQPQPQSQFISNEQQLPRQGPTTIPFRAQSALQSHAPHHPFGPTATFNAAFSNGPINANPTASSAGGPVFPTGFPRTNNGPTPTFHSRPSVQPSFPSRTHFNSPPKISFHSGPQRPLHTPQTKPFFDEAKYLQENYHTITTEQVEPPKEQLLPNKQSQTFNSHVQGSPSTAPNQFQDHRQVIPIGQQLPQQRPPQLFADPSNKQALTSSASGSTFFNLRPSPPRVEDNRPLFHQPQQHQQFSFHQGPQPSARPPAPISAQQGIHNTFASPIAASPSPLPSNQFLPQPSSPTLYNFQQPSPTPDHFHQVSPSSRPQFQPIAPSDQPQFQHHNPSERPFNQPFRDNHLHPINVGQFVQNGGELVPAVSKYEQHITVNGATAQPGFRGISENGHPSPSPSPSPSAPPSPSPSSAPYIDPLQHQYDAEQEQLRLQLAANVQKQQEEIQRLQAQILYTQQQHQQHQHDQIKQQQQSKQQEQRYKQQQQQQQHQQPQQQQQQHQQQQQQQQQQQNNYNQQKNNYNQQSSSYNQQVQATSPRSQYIQERSRPHPSSTAAPHYYQSSPKSVEIKSSTPKYSSSTANSISTTPETKKQEEKKKPVIELPDEVPDDLRQQLLSSGILDNADISVLDYDKVGETPLDSLPPDQLANFFSAGGAQQIASSENRPIIVTPYGQRIQSRIDDNVDDDDDQEEAPSENIATYVAPPSQEQAVEMKVVHFDPTTPEGQNIANKYVQENATQIDPVSLNDKKYNRYLPLKVSGNQFPLPDILKGRKITSVVVLAPVETEIISEEHKRVKRNNNLKGIKFVAGESLQDLLKKPTKDNFEKWLDVEKRTSSDMQSIVLLVTGNDAPADGKEIFMYDVSTGNVNKLSGELSNAFVEAAENNSLSKDIESLAIEGEGTPENFNKDMSDDVVADGSENVPLLVDLSGLSLDQDPNSQVSISSGYSKTKHGRSLRRH